MGYRLIKGEFHLFYQGQRHVGSRPDGDSVWFQPDRPELTQDLGDRNVDFNGGGFTQLRFEGIDALELHYDGSNHQKEAEAVAARDWLLDAIGFANVTYSEPSNPEHIPTAVRSADNHPRPGYILTRSVDPFGRPVAFAFAGSTALGDGSTIWLDTARLDRSLNAGLMAAGLVYPAYYTGLPSDLRDHLTDLADQAWAADLGVWHVDRSMNGARARVRDDLAQHAIWPKLYRRLYKYFKAGNVGLGGFDAWLRADGDRDDALWIIPLAHLGNMHDVVRVRGNRISMNYWPEELIIVPR